MMLKSFLPRAVCVFVIIQGPIWMIADVLAPYTCSFAYDSIADKVANDLANDKSAKAKHGGDIPQHYNVAWLHLTDKNKKVSVSNRPSSLPDQDSGAQSRVLDIKGSRFVEIVKALDKDEMLAVGFRCPSLMDSLFSKMVWPGQLPIGTVLLGTILNGLALGTAYLMFLGIPLSKTIKLVGEGKDLPERFPPMVSSELPTIVKAVKDRFSNLQQEHDRSITAARTDLSGAFVKEVEDKFISRLAKDIVSLQSSEAVCNLIMHRVADEFIGTVKAAYGIEFPSGGQYKIVDSLGFSEEQAKILGTLGDGGFINLIKKFSSPMFLNRDEMADKRLDQLSVELVCDQGLVIPIEFGGVVRAHVCFFIVTKDQANVQKLERIAKQISDQLAPLWHVISNYEQAYYLSRHDHLTGIKNRICMEDLMQTLRSKPKAAEGAETVFLLFEGDNFRVMLNTYGPKAIDKLIGELGQELIGSLEKTQRFKRSATKVSYADRLFRVGGCKFMLILEDANTKKAIELAENVEKNIGEKKGWANGMPSWSLSCAVASMDKENSTPDGTFEEALITMEYLRSRKSVATVMLSKDVSQEFMGRAKTRNSGGTSSLFEPT
ncbi:MAG: diguanylate cyclase, partial [Candidatus Obscuribacterales bacterium]|nr:diguanylate cyclase [Candidatus Obscuribacterales bacterium]